jgi:hypothetical protein
MEAGKAAFTNTRGEVRFADGFVQGGTDGNGVGKIPDPRRKYGGAQRERFRIETVGTIRIVASVGGPNESLGNDQELAALGGLRLVPDCPGGLGSVGSRIKRLATSVWSAAATASSVS